MILEMDFGNTRIKWRLRSDQEILARNVIERDAALDQVSDQLKIYLPQIRSIWVASVLGEKVENAVQLWAKRTMNLEPVFARSQYRQAGVVNGYDEPQRLGVDRWLAMVAAYNYYHSTCLVVSSGTAVTVDLLTGNGQHLGGYIVPGWRLAMSSLNQNTKLIRLQGSENGSLQPGLYTQAAVDHGLTACYVGLLHNAIAQLKTQTNEELVTILATGGDAGRLLDYFPDIILREELVLDGLRFCLGE